MEEMRPLSIPVILGTVRQGRQSAHVARLMVSELSRRSGIDVCPEGGAAWWAMRWLRNSNFLSPSDRVVVFNTGTGLKYR